MLFPTGTVNGGDEMKRALLALALCASVLFVGGCPRPECSDGQTQGKNGHFYVCHNGEWVKEDHPPKLPSKGATK